MTSDNPQENSDTPREQRTTNDQLDRAKAKVSTGRAEFEPPVAKDDCHKSYKAKKHWLDYATFVIEILGLGGLCIYAALTYGIYCANKRISEDTHQSVLDADAHFRVDERAWVGVQDIDGTIQKAANMETVYVTFTVKNTGKTPALKMSSQYISTSSPSGGSPPDFDEIVERERKSFERERQKWLDNAPPEKRAEVEKMFALARKTIDELFPAGLALAPEGTYKFRGGGISVPVQQPGQQRFYRYILGKITYDDIFHRESHTTKFCVTYRGPEYGGVELCPTGNDMN